MKLSDIAEVRTGLVLARKAAQTHAETMDTYRQLNLRCIRDNGSIDLEAVEVYASSEELDERYLTQPDDVIVRLSAPYTAVLVDDETKNIVVSSHFCIIRAIDGKAVPGYIYWLLNSHISKAQISKGTTGTSYASIKPSIYSELEVRPLTIIEQKRIANIYLTGKKEIALLDELKRQKETFYQTVLKDLYTKKIR
jgi:Restriction endonuclease S subunits